MLIALSAGNEIPEHHMDGPVLLQGVYGSVRVRVGEEVRILEAGDLLSLAAGRPHVSRGAPTIRAVETSTQEETMFDSRESRAGGTAAVEKESVGRSTPHPRKRLWLGLGGPSRIES